MALGRARAQVGMPEVDEMVGATLSYKLRVARGNVRKFLAAATEGVDLGGYADVVQRILGAVEQIEADTGAPLDAANEKGWKALQKRVEVRATRAHKKKERMCMFLTLTQAATVISHIAYHPCMQTTPVRRRGRPSLRGSSQGQQAGSGCTNVRVCGVRCGCQDGCLSCARGTVRHWRREALAVLDAATLKPRFCMAVRHMHAPPCGTIHT